ncbi:MAG: NUDIX hydrolase [Chloroflexota bacterium]
MASDRKAYQQTLPKKRMSAGAVFRNEDGDVLLVNPTYKEPWEIPGGAVEANESPLQACIREVKEELGLDIVPQRLLSVIYKPESDTSTEALSFIFYGGLLSTTEIEQIVLPEDELSEYRFVPPEQVRQYLLVEFAVWRLQQSLTVWTTDKTLYLDG